MKAYRALSKELSGATLLFIGAHADDIEIGCGGTIQRVLRGNTDLNIFWIVFSAQANRAEEAHTSAQHYLANVATKNIQLNDFRNGFFPYIGASLKEYFESIKAICSPDLIFTHYRQDLHQDHRVLSDLTWNTFRDHMILEYEVPKYDGDLGIPNAFISLTEADVDEKFKRLHAFFGSQHEKQWFDAAVFKGLSRIRGVECNSPTGFAEAFHSRKLILA